LIGDPDAGLVWFEAVARRQASLIAQWMNVGFIHGVMNTDNMTISGETIDYGPCAFLEAYDPRACFSSIDHQGRYAYANQPGIARWNLARLAETVLPALHEDPDQAVMLATQVLDAFPQWYEQALLEGERQKLGLQLRDGTHAADDQTLIEAWLGLLQRQQVDFTLAWRRLADLCDPSQGSGSSLHSMFSEPAALDAWLKQWKSRCAIEDLAAQRHPEQAARDRARAIRQVNPLVIPRNHQVEVALSAASNDADFAPFQNLLAALRDPFGDGPAAHHYAEPAPAEVSASYRTFCGT
jgi:uncharacterized protein YdiU (UPF0061 family)